MPGKLTLEPCQTRCIMLIKSDCYHELICKRNCDIFSGACRDITRCNNDRVHNAVSSYFVRDLYWRCRVASGPICLGQVK